MHYNPKVMTNSTRDGIERVRKGGYAYLLESTTNDYARQRDCNLMQIGDLLDAKGYGFGLQKNSVWTEVISTAILRLQENGKKYNILSKLNFILFRNIGKILQLYNKWWKQIGAINCEEVEKSSNDKGSSMDFENVFGIFIVLGVGLLIAALITVIEILWNKRIKK